MKQNVAVIVRSRLLISLSAVAVSCCLFAGCGANPEQQAKVQAQKDEIAKLEADNKEIQRLKAENQELGRLRRDNQEIQSLRSSIKELAKFRTENQQLKSGSPAGSAAVVQKGAASALNSALQGGLSSAQGETAATQHPAEDANIPQEGDEIFVDPKFLKTIIPGIDWDKLKRTEPLGIKSLLNSQGIVITNYQQLYDMGITNYRIERAPLEGAIPPQN